MKQGDQNPRPALRVAHVGHAVGLGFRRICLLAVVCTHRAVTLVLRLLFTDSKIALERDSHEFPRRALGCMQVLQHQIHQISGGSSTN